MLWTFVIHLDFIDSFASFPEELKQILTKREKNGEAASAQMDQYD